MYPFNKLLINITMGQAFKMLKWNCYFIKEIYHSNFFMNQAPRQLFFNI